MDVGSDHSLSAAVFRRKGKVWREALGAARGQNGRGRAEEGLMSDLCRVPVEVQTSCSYGDQYGRCRRQVKKHMVT